MCETPSYNLIFILCICIYRLIYLFYQADSADEEFDLIQPSLIQQLRKILDEYPDDGQVLKVK